MVAAVVGRFGKLDILINNPAQDSDIAADAMRLWQELNEAGRLIEAFREIASWISNCVARPHWLPA
jgi:hypothetical protein